jgi:hypothetical protein
VRSASTVLGSLTAGVLGGAIGIVPVLAWQGCGYLLAGSLALMLLVRRAAVEDRLTATSG